VCGLCHEALQQCLLADTTLNYNKALEIARGMESADKDSKSFKKTDSINAVRAQSNQLQSCYHCGHSNHNAANSKFKEHSCSKTRHIAPACRSKPRVPPAKLTTPGQTGVQSKGKKTHYLQDDTRLADENTNSSDDEF